MNDNIVTAHMLEELAGLPEGQERDMLRGHVQSAINRLAADWQRMEQQKGSRFAYTPQELAAAFWLRPNVNERAGGMVLVVTAAHVEAIRRCRFTMNGQELPVCSTGEFANTTAWVWNQGAHLRRLNHGGAKCGCEPLARATKPQTGPEAELPGPAADDGGVGELAKRIHLGLDRTACHGLIEDVCASLYCKLNRVFSVRRVNTFGYVKQAVRTTVTDAESAVRMSRGGHSKPASLVKSVGVEDPRLKPIVRALAQEAFSTEPLGMDRLFERVFWMLVRDAQWLDSAEVHADDTQAVRAAIASGIRELRRISEKFTALLWSRLTIRAKIPCNVDEEYEEDDGLVNERFLGIEDRFAGDEGYDESEPTADVMKAVYMRARMRRNGKSNSLKQAFVAGVEAGLGPGEGALPQALALWDQAMADKSRKAVLRDFQEEWEHGFAALRDAREGHRGLRESGASRV